MYEKPTPVSLPFFIVNGASGSGKSSLIQEMRARLPDFLHCDIDFIIGSDWQTKKINWFRIAYIAALAGRKTILYGTVLPKDFLSCDCQDAFSAIHVALLICGEDVIRTRLAERKWGEELINTHIELNKWFLHNAQTAFALPCEVFAADGPDVAAQIAEWAASR
jgi:broad-specificity NMP kinase